jgi:hypothetical protein
MLSKVNNSLQIANNLNDVNQQQWLNNITNVQNANVNDILIKNISNDAKFTTLSLTSTPSQNNIIIGTW